MKKLFALLLAIITVLALCACGGTAEPAQTQPTETQGKDYSAYAGIVADPKGWYEELMAMPIATSDMTERELRQLCVDAFRMNNTFTWTPTQEISYIFHISGKTSEILLPKGMAYAGMFYCNNDARGNVWKALEFYDHETGAMDIEAMGGEYLSILSSACAKGCEWGWSRVSNDHGLTDMSSYSQYASKVTPVGSYTYGAGQYGFSEGDGTKRIIADNGVEVMCESMALMQMADGLYSSSSYHVMMCASDPVVVRKEDGQINPLLSYVLVCEQDAVGTKTDTKDSIQENGKLLRTLGTVDNKYTFQDLMDKGYIPFAIPELVGKAPVEVGDAWIGISETNRLEDGADITLEELRNMTLGMNYALCVIYIQVKDANGNEVVSESIMAHSTPHTFSVPARVALPEELLAPYVDGNHTVTVSVRMANGELIEALTTTLKK